MVWRRKANAPPYANLANKLLTAVAGTNDAWLMPWFSLIPGNTNMNVDTFCAAGPPAPVTFDPLDFLGAGLNRLTAALSGASLGQKLTEYAYSRMFDEWCENVVSQTAWCTLFEQSYHVVNDWWAFPYPTQVQIPQAATQVRITYNPDGSGLGDVHFNFQNANHRSATYYSNLGANTYAVSDTDLLVCVVGRYGGTPYDTVVKIEYDCNEVISGYNQPDVTQPATAIPPTPGVYTTIADLGKELDNIENKLHWVVDYVIAQETHEYNYMVADDVVTVEADDEDIELNQDVLGIVVNVSNIGNQTDERFGEPRMLHRLGRVVMGNGTAWLPPVELTVSPMMLLKPDRTITACRVQVYPPATATVTTMVRAPLVG